MSQTLTGYFTALFLKPFEQELVQFTANFEKGNHSTRMFKRGAIF